MYFKYLGLTDLTEIAGENPVLLYVAAGLVMLAAMLTVVWHGIQKHTARVYNWNGKRYCYLGRVGLFRKSDGYHAHIGERIADLSYTTLYQICPSKGFVRRNRYENLILYAGDEKCMMHIDGCMQQSVYYRKGKG